MAKRIDWAEKKTTWKWKKDKGNLESVPEWDEQTGTGNICTPGRAWLWLKAQRKWGWSSVSSLLHFRVPWKYWLSRKKSHNHKYHSVITHVYHYYYALWFMRPFFSRLVSHSGEHSHGNAFLIILAWHQGNYSGTWGQWWSAGNLKLNRIRLSYRQIPSTFHETISATWQRNLPFTNIAWKFHHIVSCTYHKCDYKY